jgi:hypothetical protein
VGNIVPSYKALVEMYMRSYPAAIAKGVSTIMVFYSRWNNQKMHANKLLTDVLKGRLGFALTIDKVVQTAVLLRLEPVFESRFWDSSHRFQIGHSCHSCLKLLRSSWLVMSWLVQVDLQKLFTKAHHKILLELMAPVLYSKSLEDLIRKLLNTGYIDIYNFTDRTQYNMELVQYHRLVLGASC